MRIANARIGDALVDLDVENGVIARLTPAGGEPAAGESLDLEGRWLVPGLWDHHVHFTQWALTSQRVDLAGATSAREAARLVGEAIESGAASAGIVIGANFRDGLWPDAPRRELLDAVAPDIPVVLVSADLHTVWLNSPALAQYGFAHHASGVLVEDDAFAIERLIAELPDETVDAWARQCAEDAAARGVVGIVDLEMTWNRDVWERRIARGHDALRVQFGVYREHLDRAIAEGLRTGEHVHELLTVGRFKILTDGSLNTRTAYTFDEYPDGGGHGMLVVPREELEPLVRQSWEGGIEPTVHGIGDAAVTLALDVFEAVGCSGSIEHAQLVRPVDVPRFAALGVEVSAQPEHAMDDRDVAERYWPGRTQNAFVLRSLLDAGATLRFGSDAPVSPLDPWVTMAAAITRSRDGREPWHPEQAISPAEALAASVRSSLTVGAPADLVAVDADPLTGDGDVLRAMPVALTLLAGRPTFNAVTEVAASG